MLSAALEYARVFHCYHVGGLCCTIQQFKVYSATKENRCANAE